MVDPKNSGTQGLYCSEYEHDACGVGFLAHIKGEKTHDLIQNALLALRNLDHRGACGCEENTGDGAGILIQIPDQFFRDECATLGIDLPHIGEYGVGNLFLPKDKKSYEQIQELFSQIALQESMNVLGWRLVPTNAQGADIGATALAAEPSQIQVFVASSAKLQSFLP